MVKPLDIHRIDDQIARLDDWLFSTAVYCPSSGAIAGITEGDQAVYWYGEIAGYYLTYLAILSQHGRKWHANVEQVACSISDWLCRQWRKGPPETRIYANSNLKDWRNQLVFAFDLAMILRGLAQARAAGLKVWDGESIRQWLRNNMVDMNRGIRPVVARNRSAIPRDRWSTSLDGYQLKTSAALRIYADVFADPDLRDMAHKLRLWLWPIPGIVMSWAHLPPHPRIYAWEGMLTLCDDERTRQGLGALLPGCAAEDHADWQRVDVIAQGLRLMCGCQPKHLAVHALADSLCKAVDTRGAVRFRLSDQGPERNTWCALFARQALSFYRSVRVGQFVRIAECI